MVTSDYNFWKSLIGTWRKEWRRVKYVRRSFLTLLAIGLLVGWALGGWAIHSFVSGNYKTRIKNKDSTIENLKTRVSGYESKLKVSTPGEAEAKLKALQDEIIQLMDITPRLQIRDKSWIQEAGGTWILEYTVHSATKLTPNGLLMSFDAEGIIDSSLAALNEVAPQGGPVNRRHDVSFYIQKPLRWSRKIGQLFKVYSAI
jgi:hypothetical protein